MGININNNLRNPSLRMQNLKLNNEQKPEVKEAQEQQPAQSAQVAGEQPQANSLDVLSGLNQMTINSDKVKIIDEFDSATADMDKEYFYNSKGAAEKALENKNLKPGDTVVIPDGDGYSRYAVVRDEEGSLYFRKLAC